MIRLDQLADAGRERLELIAREPLQSRDDHGDQGQAQLGRQAVHHEEDLLDLAAQRGLGVRCEPFELRGAHRFGFLVDQQGQHERPGTIGFIGQGLERVRQ